MSALADEGMEAAAGSGGRLVDRSRKRLHLTWVASRDGGQVASTQDRRVSSTRHTGKIAGLLACMTHGEPGKGNGLSPEQKDMCARLGVSEDEYAKSLEATKAS